MAGRDIIEVGDTFTTFSDFEEKLKLYERKHFAQFYRRDARTIQAARKRITRPLTDAIKYYEVRYCCVHGGKKFQSRSNGHRETSYVFHSVSLRLSLALFVCYCLRTIVCTVCVKTAQSHTISQGVSSISRHDWLQFMVVCGLWRCAVFIQTLLISRHRTPPFHQTYQRQHWNMNATNARQRGGTGRGGSTAHAG